MSLWKTDNIKKYHIYYGQQIIYSSNHKLTREKIKKIALKHDIKIFQVYDFFGEQLLPEDTPFQKKYYSSK